MESIEPQKLYSVGSWIPKLFTSYIMDLPKQTLFNHPINIEDANLPLGKFMNPVSEGGPSGFLVAFERGQCSSECLRSIQNEMCKTPHHVRKIFRIDDMEANGFRLRIKIPFHHTVA